MLRSHTRKALLLAIGSLAFSTASNAQVVGWFWQSPSGGSGTWDLTTTQWGTGSAAAVSHVWQNDGNERANFSTAGGTVAIGVPKVIVNGINFNFSGVTLTGSGTIDWAGSQVNIGANNTGTIATQIGGGTATFAKIGLGTVILNAGNTFSQGLSVSGGGTLVGIAQSSGTSVFSSGTVSLDRSTLRLVGLSSNTTTSVGDFSITGLGNLVVDNTAGTGGTATTIFSTGNLSRTAGAVLGITPVAGTLGNDVQVQFSNGNALLTNSMLPAYVVGLGSSIDFLGYGANGAAVATYTSNDLSTSGSSDIVNSTGQTLAANASAFALRTNGAINLGGNTLTLGSGLILNSGGSIGNTNLAFNGEGLVHVQGTTTIGTPGNTITGSNGMTLSSAGVSSVTINSNINLTGGGVWYNALLAGSVLSLNGSSSYGGGTTVEWNTGSTGTISVGSNTAFGTGKITNVLAPGASSPQLLASGGARTLANAWDLNGGLTFTGTNPFTLTGAINVLTTGSSRTVQASTGHVLTLGSSGSPSVINLGNPVSNGGDGLGKTLVFTPNTATSAIVVNDVLQDPATGGGTASGGIQVAGTSGTLLLNNMNTYTGSTNMTGGGVIVPIVNSSNALPGAGFTSGPFGTGTVIVNNGTNQRLRVSGANRTISNPLSMVTGFTFDNITGETFNLTWAGPISLDSTASRTINNLMGAGASMILGSSSSPSTITLNPATDTAASVNLQLTTAATNTIVINDVIRDPSPLPATPDTVSVTGGGTMVFNGASTYVGTTSFTGAGTIVRIGVNSNALPGAGFTSGPLGVGTINVNNGSNQHIRPDGTNRSISNPIVMTTGFAMDNGTGETFSMTFAGPIYMTGAGKFISNGFSAGTAGTMIIGSSVGTSTLTGPTAASQTLSLAALAGPIVVNDLIQNGSGGAFTVAINPNGTNLNDVTFTAANTYTGTTTVPRGRLLVSNTTGSATGGSVVNVTGSSTVGSGGTIGGNGIITGDLTISSTTPASQGGVISPGSSAGTLTTGNQIWDPKGRYTWEYNASDTTTGSGVNDLIKSTGGLNLTNLSSANQFDLNLIPLAGTATNSQTYVIATFATGTGFTNGTDLGPAGQNLFTFSGLFGSTPTVTVLDTGGGAQSLQLTFNTVPEPGTLLLGALATCGLGLRPRRRRTA